MKTRILSLSLMIALLTTTLVAPLSAEAQSTNPLAQIPINISNSLGSFVGTATVERFAAQGGQLVAIGTLTGVLTPVGGLAQNITRNFRVPVTIPTASCQILTLDLGPINLDLLGLVVDISPISIDVTAQPGAGKLLGNLLCAVAGLLDNTPDVNGLATLLNRLLRLLG
jgi:hypothetical protein